MLARPVYPSAMQLGVQGGSRPEAAGCVDSINEQSSEAATSRGYVMSMIAKPASGWFRSATAIDHRAWPAGPGIMFELDSRRPAASCSASL